LVSDKTILSEDSKSKSVLMFDMNNVQRLNGSGLIEILIGSRYSPLPPVMVSKIYAYILYDQFLSELMNVREILELEFFSSGIKGFKTR
jgi:hypothetical protein